MTKPYLRGESKKLTKVYFGETQKLQILLLK